MTNQCNYPTGLLPARGRFCLVFVRSTYVGNAFIRAEIMIRVEAGIDNDK